MVVTWSHFLNLHPLVPLVLWILVCCVDSFCSSHVMRKRIKFWMEFVLNSYHALSFFMGMYGILNKKSWWRITSFCTHLVHFILTSFAIVPFQFNLMKIHLRMFLLPIIHKTHKMSVCHLIVERTNLFSWVHSISHLSFLETHRVKFFVSHQPLSMICQIMRMSLSILNFWIVAVVIFSRTHPITILIHMISIFPSHQCLMIHLLMKWKLLKLSRHFSASWWLC